MLVDAVTETEATVDAMVTSDVVLALLDTVTLPEPAACATPVSVAVGYA
jgi:hypothetical protein